MTDLHIHTHFSSDSVERIHSYISAARASGDVALGFSDHCDYDMIVEGADVPILDFDGYFRELEKAAQEFSDIRILKGVELGYSAAAQSLYAELMRSRSFDYAIMSVHSLPSRGDCYYPEFFDGLTKHEAYELYLSAVLDSVTSDIDFQILGHLGYIRRYAPYEDNGLNYADFPVLLDKILKTVIERGAALELNTRVGRLRSVVVTPLEVIDRYIELGGKNFTYGSDSHAAAHYRGGYDGVKALLATRGIKNTVVYKERKSIAEIV